MSGRLAPEPTSGAKQYTIGTGGYGGIAVVFYYYVMKYRMQQTVFKEYIQG